MARSTALFAIAASQIALASRRTVGSLCTVTSRSITEEPGGERPTERYVGGGRAPTFECG
ncbi:hypothetical protein M758_2G145600 [Ceratodon purpureus]|nr:hypothetical protein M758_2G145600 [Ceratodon purpureus]